MCCFEEAVNNLFPKGWLDPYGNMPMNRGLPVKAEITQEKTEDGGMKFTAVRTPPRADTTKVEDVIMSVIGAEQCADCCDMPS